MRIKCYFWILLVFSVSSSLSAAPKAPGVSLDQQSRPEYVPNELLVKFKPQTDALVRGSFMADLNAPDHKALPISRSYLITLPRGADARSMASLYASDPRIEYAQPNYIYYTQAVPDDTDYNNLWGLKNIGQEIANPVYTTNNPGVAGNDMDAETAWDEQTDCRSIVVAVIDTGVNYTHEDLAGNMWQGGTPYPNHGYDFVDHDEDPLPSAGESHGSHVAGTIGAVGNNATGTTGVCWQADIMSVRVLGPGGSGTTASIIKGVDFAVNQGAKIINMSLGGPGGSDGDLLSAAITDAGDAGVLVVAAAGNGGADGIGDNNDITPIYPCGYTAPNIICVAALDQGYELTSFSNYGRESVDVGAPGANIQSTIAGDVVTDKNFSGWMHGPAWSVGTGDFCSQTSLFTPTDYCTNLNSAYADDAADTAYKSFDLNGLLGAGVNMTIEYWIDISDSLRIGIDPASGDPFVSGTIIFSDSASSGKLVSFSYDLKNGNCLTAACSIGLQLLADGDPNTSYGARAYGFHINTTIDGATTYSLFNGTSMATPHVTGLAALVWSYNPDYTYADVVRSVVNSGDAVMALDSTTTSGRAVDAFRALKYIQAPTGVSASIQ